MKKLIPLLLLMVCFAAACKKDTGTNSICDTATVRYMGDPAADGLGWTLLVGDSSNAHIEIAENLAEAYKTNGLVVDICYQKTENLYYCFCAQPYKMIHLITIKKH